MIARAFLLAVLGLAAAAACAQQMYRWTDEKGRVHVTDTPPPANAREVQKKRAPAGGAASEASEPYVLQAAVKANPVTLYSEPNCGEFCSAGRKLLNDRGVPFKEVSVVDYKQAQEFQQVVGGNMVPSLVVGTAVKQGFAEAAWHAMLDAAGYPKTGMLPPRAQAEPKPPADPQAEKPAAQPEETAPGGPYSPGSRQPPRPRK